MSINYPSTQYLTTGGVSATQSAPVFYAPRDSEIHRLNMLVAHLHDCQRSLYEKIGCLHETLRGLQNFDKWSADVEHNKLKALGVQPVP